MRTTEPDQVVSSIPARVTAAALRDGDVIRIGNAQVLLRHEPAWRLDAEAAPLFVRAPALRRVRHQRMQVACTLAPVLLHGEPGMDKELAARKMHQRSGRSGELVAGNCAAIPEHLTEILLFGQERGAFKGAGTSHEGFFRAAQRCGAGWSSTVFAARRGKHAHGRE